MAARARVVPYAVALALAAAPGCGAGGAVTGVAMALTTNGLMPGDVGAVEVLVLGGPQASCARALSAASPLDDPALDVVAHALFTLDGAPKHLRIPADRHLAFYADGYRTADTARTRVARGCAEGSLDAGSSRAISIVLSAL